VPLIAYQWYGTCHSKRTETLDQMPREEVSMYIGGGFLVLILIIILLFLIF
jgi:hypothetical protein